MGEPHRCDPEMLAVRMRMEIISPWRNYLADADGLSEAAVAVGLVVSPRVRPGLLWCAFLCYKLRNSAYFVYTFEDSGCGAGTLLDSYRTLRR